MKHMIQSKDYEVEITHQDDLLWAVVISGTLTEKQQLWIWQNMPLSSQDWEKALRGMADKMKARLIQVKQTLTFQDFYEEYGNKVGKQKAANAWKRLSKADQQAAFDYIGRYKHQVSTQGVAMLYPATYLNQKRWQDE